MLALNSRSQLVARQVEGRAHPQRRQPHRLDVEPFAEHRHEAERQRRQGAPCFDGDSRCHQRLSPNRLGQQGAQGVGAAATVAAVRGVTKLENRSNRNAGSGRNARSSARRASISPIALANFAPWPEQGEATMMRGVLWQAIDDEFLAAVGAHVSGSGVGVEADIALDDRSCGAGDEPAKVSATAASSASVAGGAQASGLAGGPRSCRAAFTPRPSKSGNP